jgi:YidC/Oxa1 family membrane protein insertase
MPGFLGVPVDAAYHLVFALSSGLTPLLGGLAAAIAIIVFTMAIRLLIAPLSFRALHGQAAQARLAPRLAALRQRYARQPERLRSEMTALYQREGTSMFAGILPILAQWPVLSVVYLLFRSPRVAGVPNQLLARTLGGVPLGSHWLSGAGALSAQDGIFLGMFAVLAALCWLSARLARRFAPPAPAPSGTVKAFGGVLPYITVVIAAFAPLAAGLYLVTTMAWSSAERWIFLRRNTRSPGSAGAKTTGAG